MINELLNSKGVFGTVPNSLWIKNISVFIEKWFSVELESHREIVWSIYWNVSDSVKMRSESESLETTILPFHSYSTKTWNISNWFAYEIFQFFLFGTAPSDSSLIWDVSPCQMGPKFQWKERITCSNHNCRFLHSPLGQDWY
jgi:hypothetical protein